MDMAFLADYTVPVVVALCLGVGYVVKKWLSDVDNKFIPTIVAIIGVVANVWLSREISVETILGGLASGLASTGTFELARNLTKSKDKDDAQ